MNFLALLSNPKAVDAAMTVLEGFGHAIVTFAEHNKQHLGTQAASTLETVGTDAQMAGAVLGSVSGQSAS